jgi:cytochrome P450
MIITAAVLLVPVLLVVRAQLTTLPTPRLKFLTLFVGHLLDGSLDINERHRFYARQQALLGPVFRLLGFFGRTGSVFVKHVPEWYRKTDSDRSAFANVVPKSLLGLPMGPKWAMQRKLVAPLFSTSSIDSFLPLVHVKCVELCELWRARASGHDVAEQDVPASPEHDVPEQDVHETLSNWSLDIFGRVACAHDFRALASAREGRENPYAAAAKVILKEITRRFILGKLAPLQRAKTRAFNGALQLYRSTAEAILQRAAAGSSEASGSLAAKLAKLAESDGSSLTPSAVADEMTGLLLAGHETSSNTATWALHLLATHPLEQERVHAEVACLDLQNAKLADLYACSLLQGVMFEALRLRPTVPLVPRLVPARTTIHGHSVAKGTRIVQNKIALCEDASTFPDPGRFDPSRFGRDEYGAHGAHIVAFGVGPRFCVGYRLAEAQVLSLLAHVLQEFTLSVGSAEPREALNVTLQPVDGLLLRFKPRAAAGARSN